MTLDFRVLGPVQVIRDGVALRMGGANPRCVLALLVANRDRVVSVTSIVDVLWPDRPPADANGSVQVIISGLRRALGASDAALIQTSPPGYRLEADEQQCDLSRFARLRQDGRAAAAADRHAEAGAYFRDALAEWRGPAYADLRGIRFVDELAVGADEQRLLTLEDRIDADLQDGRHRELVGELPELTSRYPMRESIWAHYMTALYRSGRQADALAAFQTLRLTLRDELGLEPSVAVRELHEAILRQDPALVSSAGPPRATPPLSDTIAETPLPTAWLVSSDGELVALLNGRLRIGRSAENSLVIDDPKVSRLHAAINHGDGGFAVSDLGSTNGTRVNGELIGQSVLTDGDEVRIGDAAFTFRVDR